MSQKGKLLILTTKVMIK